MLSGSLAVATIGQALAQARGRFPEHGVKQVDRLLSNQGIVVWDLFADGRARKLSEARVTAPGHRVAAVGCVHAKGMKEAWCLAVSNAEAGTREIINHYAKRWTIEPGFRDTKDLRFGMGLSLLRIGDPMRRDRLLLVNAFAIVLLTLLGAAEESPGMDRHLKVNTVKHRTHSLFRQGCMLYDLMPNMPEQRLRPLIEKFVEFILQHRPSPTCISSCKMSGCMRSA